MTKTKLFTRITLNELVKTCHAANINVDFHCDREGKYVVTFNEEENPCGECKAAYMFIWGLMVHNNYIASRMKSTPSSPTHKSTDPAEMERTLVENPELLSTILMNLAPADKDRTKFGMWGNWLRTHRTLTGRHLKEAARLLAYEYKYGQ